MVEDIGEKTAISIFDFFNDIKHLEMIVRLRNAGLQFETKEEQQADTLAGLFPSGRSRHRR